MMLLDFSKSLHFLTTVLLLLSFRYDLAQQDFNSIAASMPNESINYRQLGAAISLDMNTVCD